jgi:Flp pilus assembly protein TadG
LLPIRKIECRKGRGAPASGQSLIELALTLPLLLIILFGAIDLGRLFFAYVTITNASREGARYGMTSLSAAVQSGDLQGTVKEHTISASPAVLGASTVTTECAPYDLSVPYSSAYCTSAQTGDRVRVTVTYNFYFATMYLFKIGSMTLSSSTVMVIV